MAADDPDAPNPAAELVHSMRRLYGTEGLAHRLGLNPLFTPTESNVVLPRPPDAEPVAEIAEVVKVMVEGSTVPVRSELVLTDDAHNPGGKFAAARGCLCSPLINAHGNGLRERVGDAPTAGAWFTDPTCWLHTLFDAEVVADDDTEVPA